MTSDQRRFDETLEFRRLRPPPQGTHLAPGAPLVVGDQLSGARSGARPWVALALVPAAIPLSLYWGFWKPIGVAMGIAVVWAVAGALLIDGARRPRRVRSLIGIAGVHTLLALPLFITLILARVAECASRAFCDNSAIMFRLQLALVLAVAGGALTSWVTMSLAWRQRDMGLALATVGIHALAAAVLFVVAAFIAW